MTRGSQGQLWLGCICLALLGSACQRRLPAGEVQVVSSLRVRQYPQIEARGIVLLVHGLGSNGKVWNLPGLGGLAGELWRAGFLVYSMEDNLPYPSLTQRARDLGTLLTQLSARHPGRPLYGIGHDLGSPV